MNNVIDKLHKLSLEPRILLEKISMGEFKHRKYEFAPVLEKSGFLEKIDEEPYWKLIPKILSYENGTLQALIEMNAFEHEQKINQKIQEERRSI